MVCLLSQNRGLLVHAFGVDDGGRGLLFAGNSTHGKSATACLWKDRAAVLNDDRIWMYGTPWHGDYDGVAPHGVPLEKLIFLHHAPVDCPLPARPGASAASRIREARAELSAATDTSLPTLGHLYVQVYRALGTALMNT